MDSKDRIFNYLLSVEIGEGYITLDRLDNMDIPYDPDLEGISLSEIVKFALNCGWKLGIKEGEYALIYRG